MRQACEDISHSEFLARINSGAIQLEVVTDRMITAAESGVLGMKLVSPGLVAFLKLAKWIGGAAVILTIAAFIFVPWWVGVVIGAGAVVVITTAIQLAARQLRANVLRNGASYETANTFGMIRVSPRQ